MSLSRRELLFGRLFGSRAPEPDHFVVQDSGEVEEEPPPPWARPAPKGRGVARVLPFSCLNAFGSFCSTCVERCPVEGAMRLDGRKVVIDAARCDGCGACAPACPAPGGAIVFLPKEEAP